MEKLQWQLELLDKISAPAERANKTLMRLNITLSRVGEGMDGHGRAARSAASGLESWVTKLNSAVGIASTLAGAISGVTRSLVGMGAGLGQAVIDQAAFHESTMTTLTTLLGEGAGRREFATSLRLGSILSGTTEQFVGQRRNLAAMGFTDVNERDRMFALIQDLSAMNPTDTTVGDRAGLAFSQIRAAGHLNQMDLHQVANLNAGIGLQDVYRQIAQGRGLHGANVGDQVEGLIRHHRIGSNEALNAIAQVSMSHTHGALGHFAGEQGNSIAGMMSNIKDAPAMFLQRMFLRQGGADRGAGMGAFKDTLRSLNEMMAEGSPQAERLLSIFERLIDGVFGQLRTVNPVGVVNAMLDTMDKLVPVVISAATWLRTLFGAGWKVFSGMLTPLLAAFGNSGQNTGFLKLLEDTGKVMGAVAGVVVWFFGLFTLGVVMLTGGLYELFAWIGRTIGAIPAFLDALGAQVLAWLSGLGAWFENAGLNIANGIANGIRNGAAAVWDAIQSLGHSAVDSTESVFDMHSPSRVMARLGANVGAGLAVGIDGSTDHVAESVRGLLPSMGGATLAGLTARAQGAGAGQSAAITITFALPPGMHDPEAIANATRPVVLSAVAEALERAALESGV